MENKLKEKVFYTMSCISFGLLSMAFSVDGNSIYGFAFGIVAFCFRG